MLHLEWIPASASQRKSKVRHLHLEVEQGCCHGRGVQSKLTATDWLRLATELTATDSVSLARRSCALIYLQAGKLSSLLITILLVCWFVFLGDKFHRCNKGHRNLLRCGLVAPICV